MSQKEEQTCNGYIRQKPQSSLATWYVTIATLSLLDNKELIFSPTLPGLWITFVSKPQRIFVEALSETFFKIFFSV